MLVFFLLIAVRSSPIYDFPTFEPSTENLGCKCPNCFTPIQRDTLSLSIPLCDEDCTCPEEKKIWFDPVVPCSRFDKKCQELIQEEDFQEDLKELHMQEKLGQFIRDKELDWFFTKFQKHNEQEKLGQFIRDKELDWFFTKFQKSSACDEECKWKLAEKIHQSDLQWFFPQYARFYRKSRSKPMITPKHNYKVATTLV